jgi:hypothetical protein
MPGSLVSSPFFRLGLGGGQPGQGEHGQGDAGIPGPARCGPGPDRDPRPVVLARAVRPGAGRDLLPGPRRDGGNQAAGR